jgi:hypothetical protein
MNYFTEGCGTGFTPDQVIRMQALWELRKETANKADVVFVIDISGSFRNDLQPLKDQVQGILANITAVTPDSEFGLVTFSDYPLQDFGNPGDKAYELVLNLTSDQGAFIAAVNNLVASGGGDDPESQLTALYQMVTGEGQSVDGCDACAIMAGQQINFRPGAAAVAMLWTDAVRHGVAVARRLNFDRFSHVSSQSFRTVVPRCR